MKVINKIFSSLERFYFLELPKVVVCLGSKQREMLIFCTRLSDRVNVCWESRYSYQAFFVNT